MRMKINRILSLLVLSFAFLGIMAPCMAFASEQLTAASESSLDDAYSISIECSGGDATLITSVNGVEQSGMSVEAKSGDKIRVAVTVNNPEEKAVQTFRVIDASGTDIDRQYTTSEETYQDYYYTHYYEFTMPASNVTASCVLGNSCWLMSYCTDIRDFELVVTSKASNDKIKESYLEHSGSSPSGQITSFYVVAPGDYTYQLYDKSDNSLFDSGTIAVSADTGMATISWNLAEVTIRGAEIEGLGYVGTDSCYYVTEDGLEIYPTAEQKNPETGLYHAYFALKGTDAGVKYKLKATPEDDRCVIAGNSNLLSELIVYGDGYIPQQLGGWQASTNEYKVSVPEGSNLHAYRHPGVAYKQWGEVAPISTETADGKTTYTFKTASGYLELVAGGTDTGYAKTYWSKEFRAEDETVEMEVPRTGAEGYSTREEFDGLYLNVADDGCYKALSTGESCALEGFRVYQPTLEVTSNRYVEPDMSYELIAGDSVSISDVQGGEGRSYVNVTAEKPGVSIVKITYGESYVTAVNGRLVRYGAIAPEQTGIVIFDVDGAGSAIETGIGLRKYDTVYFAGSVTQPDGTVEQGKGHGEYTFAPGEGVAVRTHKPYQIESSFDGSSWEEQAAGEDGSYTIPVYTGRNIVELSKDGAVRYFVINAMETDVTISNLTNPGQAVKAGDEVSVGYTNLELPVQKMTAIYNPGWYDPNYGMSEDSGTFLVGTLSDGGEPIALRGERTQYDIQAVSELTFTAPAAGDYELAGVQIHSTHMGSPLDSHCSIPLSGLPQNLDADNNDQDPDYCVLPGVAMKVLSEVELARAQAIAELEAYLDPENYLEAQQAEIAQAIAEAKEAINAAETPEAVAELLDSAKSTLDAVETADRVAEAATPVADAIAALPAADALTAADKAAVEAVCAAYDELTSAEKAAIPETSALALKLAVAVIDKIALQEQVDALGKDNEALSGKLAEAEAKVKAAEDELAKAKASEPAAKKANTMKVSTKAKTLKAKVLKKKAKTFKAVTVKGAKGKVAYAKVKVNKKKLAKKFAVNKKTGKITVKKGVKKGTYKVTVKVKAAGNADYEAASKNVVVKVTVK